MQHNSPISLSFIIFVHGSPVIHPGKSFALVSMGHFQPLGILKTIRVLCCSTCFRHEPAESSVICSRAVGSNFLLQNCPKMNRFWLAFLQFSLPTPSCQCLQSHLLISTTVGTSTLTIDHFNSLSGNVI